VRRNRGQDNRYKYQGHFWKIFFEKMKNYLFENRTDFFFVLKIIFKKLIGSTWNTNQSFSKDFGRQLWIEWSFFLSTRLL